MAGWTEHLARCEVILGDSRKMTKIGDDEAGFCFTSPPYYNQEHYDDHPDQLGGIETYDQFLSNGIAPIVKELYRCIKPGGLCAWNIGDWRRDGVFFPFYADTVACFKEAGWLCHDTWVLLNISGGINVTFAVSIGQRGYAPRVHEYLAVFRKPE